jgi:hypothetical protein
MIPGGSTTPQNDWKRGDAITAARLNGMQARALTDVRVGPGLILERFSAGFCISLANPSGGGGGISLKWLKVTTGADTNNVAVCRDWDGTNTGAEDINVLVSAGLAAGQTLYASRVSPTTGATISGNPVDWVQIVKPLPYLFPVLLTQCGDGRLGVH